MLNRWGTVTHIYGKFLCSLGQRPLHAIPLQDHLLVGVDRGFRIVRVVPRLVAARLVGGFRCQ